ncbi:hypothetical protein M728_001415 [Ensifer sp. WSM1721]
MPSFEINSGTNAARRAFAGMSWRHILQDMRDGLQNISLTESAK